MTFRIGVRAPAIRDYFGVANPASGRKQPVMVVEV